MALEALTQFDNPVLWQEVVHQNRGTRRWLRGWRLLGPALLAVILIAILISLTNIQLPTRDTAMVAIWIVHAAAAIFAMVAGANAISREHVGATWDALVLTGLSARRILFGKWRAALRRSAGWMVVLGVIQAVMVPVNMVATVNRFAWFGYGYTSGRYTAYPLSDAAARQMTWEPAAAITAVILSIMLPVLEVLCCTALGIAASAVARRGTLAIILATTVRFLPVAFFAGFTRFQIGGAWYRWWRIMPFALADGGTASLYQLSLPSFLWARNRQFEAIPGILLACALLILLMVISLLAAWTAIRRSGALPDAK